MSPIGGECVGHDIGAGEGVLYVHGPDADALIEAIRTTLSDAESGIDAYAIKRYGTEDDETAPRNASRSPNSNLRSPRRGVGCVNSVRASNRGVRRPNREAASQRQRRPHGNAFVGGG